MRIAITLRLMLMMNRIILGDATRAHAIKATATILLIVSLTVGCGSKEQVELNQGSGAAGAAMHSRAESKEKSYLAYEHSIAVEVDEANLKIAYEQLIDTCRTDKESECTVLLARITSTQYLSAQLRVRASSRGVKKLLELASSSGQVLSESTEVEDLAKPVVDAEKRLAMLRDYHAKLIENQAKSEKDVDSLNKIAEKLASVQADLELAAGENAHLLSRVKLELLNVSLSAHESRSLWSPIKKSLREFPNNLSSGMSSALVGLAFALPWLIVLAFVAIVLRAAWRRFRRH
jgi:hypothetical protein